mmetsp:Transcript_56974/g.114339  ORF Transcript_56974/g.114339 Transcript_56974/m.114339 type:complete len:422 (-) Transcript_56974:411-1676(-)
MGWSPQWYIALLAAQFVGVFMETDMLSALQKAQIEQMSWTLGFILQIPRAVAAVSLGVMYDRMGPRLPLAISSLSYLLFTLCTRCLGFVGFLPHTVRIMAHPSFGFILLGLQDCAPEDRPSFLARMYMMGVLAIFSLTHIPWSSLSPSIATFICVAAFALHAALAVYLTAPGQGGPCLGADDDKIRRRPSGSPGSALLLPAPTSASSGMSENVGKLLSRPEVYTLVLITSLVHVLDQAGNNALFAAAYDKGVQQIDMQEFDRAFYAFFAIVAMTWSYLPAMYVNKYGPKPIIQTLLQAVAIINVVVAIVYMLPAPGLLRMLRALVLQGSLVVAKLAGLGLMVVTAVFFAGITGPSERGTVMSFMEIFDSGRGMPNQLYYVVGLIFSHAGVTTVYSLCAAGCIALLVLYRGSVLVKFQLKDV